MKTSHQLNGRGVPEHRTQEFLEDLKNSEVRNLNNEAGQLAPSGVDEINHSAEGYAGRTSRSESIQRYADAVKDALEREYLEFLYSSMGSWKLWAYVAHVEKELSLTEEQARVAQEEVVEEFRKSADPNIWNIFLNGTPEQREALQDAIACEMYGDDPNEATADPSSNSKHYWLGNTRG